MADPELEQSVPKLLSPLGGADLDTPLTQNVLERLVPADEIQTDPRERRGPGGHTSVTKR
jgi:hypothetical protein